ncbi:MAG TPA: ATP-binding protein [Thermoanaerobaculia bacterium]|nr:ATP-binding protein [Thermoanaerobaculia bacterium]
MTAFIGRQEELRVLTDAYAGPGSAFIPIYGRRRVGKSELILQLLKERPGIYLLGKQAPAALQIREFLELAAAVLDEPLLATYTTESWSAALDAVVSRWRSDRKLILALDEFQWSVGASPELPSVLQEKWDRQWKRAGNVLLILCGSYIGFMEREVLGKKSPLFGRRTAQIRLRPFGFREAAQFHPRYSRLDQARAYFLCGGVPLYLRFFSDTRSIEKNIAEQFLDEYAPLHREGDFLLREELREVESYYAILLALASGHTTNHAIAGQTGGDARGLHYYLQQLLDLGYLRRRYPLTGEKPAARHVRYELADPLLRFWFRFVFPHMSYIRHMGPEQAFKDLIRPHLDAYYGQCFERLCREALPDLYRREGVHAAFEVGEYWSKATQIDLVGLREDNWTDLGECKWGTVRSPQAVLRELEDKVTAFPNRRGATIGRRIFSRQRPPGAEKLTGVRWHGLEEMYGDEREAPPGRVREEARGAGRA